MGHLAIVLLMALTSFPPARSQFSTISVPDLHLSSGERVVGFHFEVTSGRIAQIPDAPIGWNISVVNDPSWNTKIDGSIMVAAASVDTPFFQDFLIVEKDESLGNPFEMRGEVNVSKDFSNVRQIKIGMKDLVIGKFETPGARP